MNGKHSQGSIARRLFLTRLGMGVSVAGATIVPGRAARAQSAVDAHWQPARHAPDDWFDKIPGQHRFVFDTTTADGIGMALQFANKIGRAHV